MSFTLAPITVNSDIRKMIDPDNLPYYPLKNSNRPEFIAENSLVLAVSFIDNNSEPVVLNASDTFDGGGDIDFIHTVANGTLSAGLTASAVITSIVAVVSPTADVPTSGNLRLFNSSNNWEIIPYTAYDSGTNTFTIDSYTMLYTYAISDTVKVTDNLMFYFDNDSVDIAGDWADIDRPTGKISIRINCGSDSFNKKMEDFTTGRTEIKIEIRRYPVGESIPSTMLLDYAYANATVVDRNGEPGYTSIQYLTQTSGDVRYVRQALSTAYSAVATPAGTDKFFMRQGSNSNYMTLDQIKTYSTDIGTVQECADDTATAIELGAIATYRQFEVSFVIDDGTNYILYKYNLVHDGTNINDDGGTITVFFGSEISGVAITFDISGGQARLIVTLTGVGNVVDCVYSVIHKLIIST